MQKLYIVILSSLFLFACTQKQAFLDVDKPLPTGTQQQDLADKINIDKLQTTPTEKPLASPTTELKINFKNSKTTDMLKIKTVYGDIVIKLYTDKAPNFINNFVTKAQNKYFDGLTFHRVEPGFVVQGGDPKGNGTGGGQIASEMNDVPFVRGSVGVARGGDIKINNDSQFYICLATETCSQLTSQYTNFGEVVSGMEFVDQIKVGDKIIEISPVKGSTPSEGGV